MRGAFAASVAGIVLLIPMPAAAQAGGASASGQGPMIVERIYNGFLVAPDVKVTAVDRKTSELVGGYAGWLTDNALFIGGGGYWLASQSRDRQMAYGGLVVQWLARTNERLGFSAKALVGGGQATLSNTVAEILGMPDVRGTPFDHVDPNLLRTEPISTRIRFREDFFVAEPEANVLVRLATHVRLTGGVGYRFTSTGHRNDTRLSGAAGSLALQIGGGS